MGVQWATCDLLGQRGSCPVRAATDVSSFAPICNDCRYYSRLISTHHSSWRATQDGRKIALRAHAKRSAGTPSWAALQRDQFLYFTLSRCLFLTPNSHSAELRIGKFHILCLKRKYQLRDIWGSSGLIGSITKFMCSLAPQENSTSMRGGLTPLMRPNRIIHHIPLSHTSL
jgi:hypothetical protein